MRLLEIGTGEDFNLVELSGNNMKPYAILSHVWGEPEQEVTYKDMVEKTGRQKAGYDKIKFCAKQAETDGIQYFWVDTCCIDKSSSAELSEAINSMYHWYENATICYAYLFDVCCSEASFPTDITIINFSNSRWFERGWTLQELIAPHEVVFYSKEWRRIGTKLGLAKDLTKITGIDDRVLGGAHPSICSIADRMSWAANRKTTREEDIAYSLLGIFDINMPLLYGERGKAFIRLQEEIMRVLDDQSIFAWKSKDSASYAGLLAISPSYFAESRGLSLPGISSGREPSSKTSIGIQAMFNLRKNSTEYGTYVACLACHPTGSHWFQYAIVLQHIEANQYIRVKTDTLEVLPRVDSLSFPINKTVYVRQDLFQPLKLSRFLGSTNLQHGIKWFWMRGMQGLHFSYPSGATVWYPGIALFGLREGQIGKVLVTELGVKNRRANLFFGIQRDLPFCALDEPSLSSNVTYPWEERGYVAGHQLLMEKSREIEVFMTAEVDYIEIPSCTCTIVTVCFKTVGTV